jgi:hypothetical protein
MKLNSFGPHWSDITLLEVVQIKLHFFKTSCTYGHIGGGESMMQNTEVTQAIFLLSLVFSFICIFIFYFILFLRRRAEESVSFGMVRQKSSHTTLLHVAPKGNRMVKTT